MDSSFLSILVQAAVKGSIVCVAALVMSALARHAAPGARHSLLLAALASFLLMPALGAMAPSISVAPPTILAPAPTPSVSAEAPAADSETAPAAAVAPPGGSHLRAPFSWQALALAAWAAGAVLLLLRLGVGALQARQIIRAARPLAAVGPGVLVSSRCLVPFAAGILRPVIVVPATLVREGGPALAAVIAHEQAHARRHDTLAGGVACVICALFWFSPFAWMAFAQLRLEQERACDEEAAAAFCDRPGYAKLLVRLGAAASRPAILSVRASGIRVLERRVRGLLAGASPRVSPRVRASLMVAAVMVIVPLALVRCAPAPAKPQDAPASAASTLPPVMLQFRPFHDGTAEPARSASVSSFDYPVIMPVDRATIRTTSLSPGIDLEAKPGDKVYAAGAGTVDDVGNDAVRGFFVRIANAATGFTTLYAGLRDPSLVKAGDVVGRRQQIGVLGTSLHVEITQDGTVVDALKVLQGTVEAVAAGGSGAPREPSSTPATVTTASGMTVHESFSPLLWPLRDGVGVITTDFGPWINPFDGTAQFHLGIDIAWHMGTEIRSAHSGTVIAAGFDAVEGNYVRISDAGLDVYYAHLGSVRVREGATVILGETIATMGTSGRSTGPHVHFEVRWKGRLVNPLRVLPLTASLEKHVGDW